MNNLEDTFLEKNRRIFFKSTSKGRKYFFWTIAVRAVGMDFTLTGPVFAMSFSGPACEVETNVAY